MPIYIEARNIGKVTDRAGGHLYLVYVPIGQEEVYTEWETIGAFPQISGISPPWGDLQVRHIGANFSATEEDSYTSLLSVFTSVPPEDPGYNEAVAPFLPVIATSRGRTLIASGEDLEDENASWASLKAAATALRTDSNPEIPQYTYKAYTLDDSGPWPGLFSDEVPGPAVNSNSVIATIVLSAFDQDVTELLPIPWSVELFTNPVLTYIFSGGLLGGLAPGASTPDGTHGLEHGMTMSGKCPARSMLFSAAPGRIS
jgi:hypothetical protein